MNENSMPDINVKHICPRRKEIPASLWRGDGDEWLILHDFQDAPRCCTYCGGAHPDDVLDLMEGGWEIEPTTEAYKRYLNSPGTRKHRISFLNAMQNAMKNKSDDILSSKDLPQFHGFTVKVYIQHFSEEQIRRFNIILGVCRR